MSNIKVEPKVEVIYKQIPGTNVMAVMVLTQISPQLPGEVEFMQVSGSTYNQLGGADGIHDIIMKNLSEHLKNYLEKKLDA